MELTDIDRLTIRLQSLYDMRTVFAGSEFAGVRMKIDDLIRHSEEQLALTKEAAETASMLRPEF